MYVCVDRRLRWCQRSCGRVVGYTRLRLDDDAGAVREPVDLWAVLRAGLTGADHIPTYGNDVQLLCQPVPRGFDAHEPDGPTSAQPLPLCAA